MSLTGKLSLILRLITTYCRSNEKKSLVHFWWRKAIISTGSLGGSICSGRGSGAAASFSAFWHQQLLSIDFWALLFWPETPPPLPCGARPTVGDGCVICGKMGPAAAHSLATKHPCNEQPPREGERSAARWVNGDSTRKVPSITEKLLGCEHCERSIDSSSSNSSSGSGKRASFVVTFHLVEGDLLLT